MTKQAFVWNATLYDGKHQFVSTFGSSLVELLAPKEGERILDLGCGTGDLARQLVEAGADVVGVDYSETMIATATTKYPTISFQVQDALNLPYMNEFDAVFSNAVLHWIQQPERVLQQIYKSLKVGGRLVVEFGGKGNVAAISNAVIAVKEERGYVTEFPWYYPSIGEYTSLLEKVGFHVQFAQHYNRPTPLTGEEGLRNWLRMFGHSLLSNVPSREQQEIIIEVENRLKGQLYEEQQSAWMADYKRIRITAKKMS